MVDLRVRRLIEWIAKNSEAESILLTPHPAHLVDAHATLKQIALLFRISEADMTRMVDNAHAQVQP